MFKITNTTRVLREL